MKLLAVAVGLSVASVSLVGCGQEVVSSVAEPIVRPALIEVVSSTRSDSLSFNGVVRAAERADLSFRIGGRLTELLVSEGDRVRKGQLLARLDERDAATALASSKIELKNTEAEYLRAKAIYDKSKAISKSQLDEITTRYGLAKNRRDEAQRQLDYTRITAPFDGIIGRRFVDNFVQVQANNPVFTLHNIDNLEVVIHIPDSVMLSNVSGTEAKAEISAIPNHLFDLSLKTFATQADPISQTYPVVLGFSDLQGYRVLPGMTVKVIPVESGGHYQNSTFTLPIVAIVPDNQGKQFVWVVSADNTVSKRYVEVGALSRDRIVITANLTTGEQVVVAGTASLEDGMEIRPMSNGHNEDK
ncbi:efflux RND transporter periplasmic adaptor subunit [Photobacterium lutimaris]|uniref:Efflux RND transporter periplasmic adaptor subunit n=1 Tax=Photobacterium lutimaris TaxID=388278 RepID=A0A2T3J5E1_9GAMM|nr:efflux RND transporter periplasmic adaptor subunit [Photobacterium lutimaris]PSU36508.1 efflux RND transporter periplasmic adaptor subunit [Photobacterium lutimaris]